VKKCQIGAHEIQSKSVAKLSATLRNHCPALTEIAVRDLLKSVSRTLWNPQSRRRTVVDRTDWKQPLRLAGAWRSPCWQRERISRATASSTLRRGEAPVCRACQKPTSQGDHSQRLSCSLPFCSPSSPRVQLSSHS